MEFLELLRVRLSTLDVLFFEGKFASLQKLLRRRRRRGRRSVSKKEPEKTMELMVAADRSAINYHGKEFLHTYLLSIGNIVSENELC